MTTTPKINNVRVHVWTKAQLRETVKQLKAGGFKVLQGVSYPGSVRALDFDGTYVMLMAMPGPGNMMLVRLDDSYFNYND